MRNGYVIMGDMNARFGRTLRDLAALYELPGLTFSYPLIEDDSRIMNDNAKFLSTICLDNKLIVVNNALFPGDIIVFRFFFSKSYQTLFS